MLPAETRIFLSLGSNLGNRRKNLRRALQLLEHFGVRVVRRSSFYETEPVDLLIQPDFLNIVCEVRSALSAEGLLAVCLEVESQLARVRTVPKGPRTIDIDILFYGDRVIDHEGLVVPHPRLSQRSFVLVPLVEIAPEFPDPGSGMTIQELADRSPDRSGVTRVD